MAGRLPRAELAAILRRVARPPLRDWRFWVVQAMVVVIAAIHLLVDINSGVETRAFPVGIPAALLLVPVSYAALHYGLWGSGSTGVWATMLWLPDLLLPNGKGHIANDVIDLALIDVVAFFVGWHFEIERLSHSRALRASAERLAAEARYAQLVVSAEEDQRKRLSRELHDEPLQLILHLARSLEIIEEEGGVPPGARRNLSRARDQALEAAVRLRNLARALRPPALDQLGLVAAVSSLLAEAEEEAVSEAPLELSGQEVRLRPEVELGVFRIVQEAVRNTTRHANAKHLRVGVCFGKDELELRVVDDGCGFDFPQLSSIPPEHLGLLGMRERARLLGGRLEVRSGPGRGTVVEACIPLGPAMHSVPGPPEYDRELTAAL